MISVEQITTRTVLNSYNNVISLVCKCTLRFVLTSFLHETVTLYHVVHALSQVNFAFFQQRRFNNFLSNLFQYFITVSFFLLRKVSMYLIVISFVSTCVYCTCRSCGAPRRPWLHFLLVSVLPVHVFFAADNSDCQAVLQWWSRSDIKPWRRGQVWSRFRQKASSRASAPKRKDMVPQKALCLIALFTTIWCQVTATLCQSGCSLTTTSQGRRSQSLLVHWGHWYPFYYCRELGLGHPLEKWQLSINTCPFPKVKRKRIKERDVWLGKEK